MECLRYVCLLLRLQARVVDLLDALDALRRGDGLFGRELRADRTGQHDDTVMALGILRRLREAGVHITLDDFGTGYSSLNHVRSFPFEKLKIDKSFVQNMGTDPKALSLIRTILALAANVGLTVVAEGVETAQQLEILRALQCGEVQGFLLGSPSPAEQVGEYIRSR